MNHPTFRIAPTSISGYSLLQWDEPGQRFPHSIQVPTATAEFIVESVKRAQQAPGIDLIKLMKLARKVADATMDETLEFDPRWQDANRLACMIGNINL